MLWFPNKARYWVSKLEKDINFQMRIKTLVALCSVTCKRSLLPDQSSLHPSSPPSIFPGINIRRVSIKRVVRLWFFVAFVNCFVDDLVVENAFINWLSHPLLLSLTFQGEGKLTYDFSVFHTYYFELNSTASKNWLEIKAVEQNLGTRIALLCDRKILHLFIGIFWHSSSCDATNNTSI